MPGFGQIISNALGAVSGPIEQVNTLLGIGAPLGSLSNDPENDVSIAIFPAPGSGQQISGWKSVRITRGIERMPGDFDIEVTEKYPGDVAKAIIQPGFPCTVKIGTDTVITGYVDKYIPSIDDDSHTIRICGRSKCQDLVDCSAIWSSGQITGANAYQIAQKLAQPYGIDVVLQEGTPLPAVPQMQLMYPQSPADIIHNACGNSALLYYDDQYGNLMLSQVGTVKAASGFDEKRNVQRASMVFSMDQRFRYINVRLQSMANLTDAGNKGSTIFPADSSVSLPYDAKGVLELDQVTGKIADEGITRFRNKNIICDYPGIVVGSLPYPELRWNWESKRRMGRSFKLDVTIDSWRDAAGILWTPNTLVPVNIPSCRIFDVLYVISEVTFMRDEQRGTTARITALPPDAFNVEPIVIVPYPLPDAGLPIKIPGRADEATTTSTAAEPAVTATSPLSEEAKAKLIILYGEDGEPVP